MCKDEGVTGAIEQQIDSAWDDIEYGRRKIRGYSTVVLQDQVAMAAVIQMGGWYKVCESRDRHLKEKFSRSYKAILMDPEAKLPNKLKGLQEEVDVKPRPKPVWIGDPKECERIYRGEAF